MRLIFDADDDPAVEAVLLARPERVGSNRFGHERTIRLSDRYETHHVHTDAAVGDWIEFEAAQALRVSPTG